MVISNESSEHAPQKRRKVVVKKAKGKPGRPSVYTEERGEIVCLMICQGKSLMSIETETGIPRSTIIGWAVDQNHPFSAHYMRAREIRAELMMDEIEAIADDETDDYQRSRLRVDTRKWILAKMRPRVYGDTGHGVSINNTVIAQTIQRTEEEDERFLEMQARVNKRLGLVREAD